MSHKYGCFFSINFEIAKHYLEKMQYPEIISISTSLEGHFLISEVFLLFVVKLGVGKEETEQSKGSQRYNHPIANDHKETFRH